MDWGDAYIEHHDAVCVVLRGYIPAWIRPRADPEDFLHDAMISLLSQPNEAYTKSRNLIIRVARRRIMDEMRRPFGKLQISLELLTLADTRPAHTRIVEADDLLGGLERRCRSEERILVRMKAEGWSTPDAASRLGMGLRRAQRFLERLEGSLC